MILLAGIASIVVFTQHSFVGGLKRGGKKLIDRTREEADNYRDYAEKRREKMQQRRAEIEEERRLAIEQKEDEKILRMEKKVSGVMLDTSLAKEDDEVKEFEEELAKAESKPKQSNIFIPDEDEFHDDIHEITLKNEEYEVKTDVESDGQHVFREEEFVPEKDYESFASENRFREREPERPKEKPYERSRLVAPEEPVIVLVSTIGA